MRSTRAFRAGESREALLASLLLLPCHRPAGRGSRSRVAAVQHHHPARASAPIDLTGYWVAVVNEDWRYRMVTPAKGDYGGVRSRRKRCRSSTTGIRPQTRRREECKSWCRRGHAAAGSASHHLAGRHHTEGRGGRGHANASLSIPGRPAAAGTPTWQGDSTAQWERGGGRGAPPVGGSLTVVTRNMRPGYLRKNGVPARERDRHGAFRPVAISWWPDARRHHGGRRSAVSTAATHRQLAFQRKADGSKWDPTPCSARW